MTVFQKQKGWGWILSGLLAATVFSATVSAQSVQESIKDTQSRALPDAKPKPIVVQPEAEPVPAPVPGALADVPVPIAGSTVYTQEQLRSVCAGLFPAADPSAGVRPCRTQIQALYRRDGYIFTRVVSGRQRQGAGEEIRILEAEIGKVTVETPDGPIGELKGIVEEFLAGLDGVKNPRVEDVERAILLVQDIPGVGRAMAVPNATADGVIDIAVQVSKKTWEGAVGLEKQGSPVLGSGNAFALVRLNGQLPWGDRTELLLMNTVEFVDVESSDFRERRTIQLSHEAMLGSSGLRGRVTGFYSKSRPGESLTPLALSGETYLGRLELSYPLMRSRLLSLWAEGGLEGIDSQVDVSNGAVRLTDDRLRVLALGLRLEQRDASGGWTRGKLELRQGFDAFGASKAGSVNISRFDGRPDFTTARLELEREQPLAMIDEALSNVIVRARIQAQATNEPLLAPEEFSVGATSFGRGYDPSELTGDHGVAGSLELAYQHRFEDRTVLEVYGFLDGGRVWNRGTGEPRSAGLASAGAGLRLNFDEGWFAEAEIAKPMTRTLDRTDDKDPSFLFRLRKSF